MKFVTVRELRTKSADVWQSLDRERELVVTSNGRPTALLVGVDADNLEADIAAWRQARAIAAMDEMHRVSIERGHDRLSDAEIEAEIAAVRKKRK